MERKLQNIKGKYLRYITLGYTKLYPFKNFYASHSVDINEWQCKPAHIYFEFGDDLDVILRLTCESSNYVDYEFYRYKIENIKREEIDTRHETKIELSEKIKTIKFYETSNITIDYSKFPNNIYPNGILIEFISGNFLGIKGSMGEDQCEPCHLVKFILSDEIEIYKIEWMKDWKFSNQIIIE